MMTDLPFRRTTCACPDCIQCCIDQPGALIPGDFERIADHLGLSHQEAEAYFWASPGALVMHAATGRQFRVGSITPRVVRKRCVFLTDENRCRIHAVAPAGCAYFDTHLSAQAAMPISIALTRAMQEPAYQALRQRLPFATHSKPRGY